MLKEVGGFFELSLMFNNDAEYHKNALKLNSGRNALWYLLKVKRPSKVYIPYYICESVVNILKKCDVQFEYYSINHHFETSLYKELKSREMLLYVNYFGINNKNVENITKKYSNVIIDNTQAFFMGPTSNSPTFYSPRKFFGVADGGYLYIDEHLDEDLDIDYSYYKYEYLLKRIDVSAEESYNLYLKNESFFSNQPIKKMSKVTQLFLQNIDYDKIKLLRESNFLYMHYHLAKYNELEINITDLCGPMVYPLFCRVEGLKDYLIRNKVYVATYWKEVLDYMNKDSFEAQLAKYLVPLPIDQRYDHHVLDQIIQMVENYLSGVCL